MKKITGKDRFRVRHIKFVLSRTLRNLTNRLINLKQARLAEVQDDFYLFDKAVNKLTNWQRNQWSRAGYPGLRGREVNLIEPYLLMKKAI